MYTAQVQRRLQLVFVGTRLLTVLCAAALTVIGVERPRVIEGPRADESPIALVTSLGVEDDPPESALEVREAPRVGVLPPDTPSAGVDPADGILVLISTA